jgi:hypothetical protein
MAWESVNHANGTWFWWMQVGSWTAWVIDDSWKRGEGTKYRIAVSLRTVTFFASQRMDNLRAAKYEAIELLLKLQSSPLQGSGRFSRRALTEGK